MSRAWGPSTGWLVLAVACVAIGAAAAWWAWPSAPPPPAAAAAPAAVAVAAAPVAAAGTEHAQTTPAPAQPAVAAVSAAAPRIEREHEPGTDTSPTIVDFINEGERPTMGEVIDRLHRAGVTTGLGAFQPPGTRPPLVGLAVPEDFVLPEGYVRHFQATDDGQRIEPILMFSPDHPPAYDAARRPITIPANRVVPPELAPPGLPIRQIVIPAPAESAAPGR